jgi:hypothetical protein
VKEGGGAEGECEREHGLGLLLCHEKFFWVLFGHHLEQFVLTTRLYSAARYPREHSLFTASCREGAISSAAACTSAAACRSAPLHAVSCGASVCSFRLDLWGKYHQAAALRVIFPAGSASTRRYARCMERDGCWHSALHPENNTVQQAMALMSLATTAEVHKTVSWEDRTQTLSENILTRIIHVLSRKTQQP